MSREYARRIEYWRSRVDPRGLVYWRYVNHKSCRYTPDWGAPGDLARLIRKACAEYGNPQRTVRPGIGGPVTVLTFHSATRGFRFRPSVFQFRE